MLIIWSSLNIIIKFIELRDHKQCAFSFWTHKKFISFKTHLRCNSPTRNRTHTHTCEHIFFVKFDFSIRHLTDNPYRICAVRSHMHEKNEYTQMEGVFLTFNMISLYPFSPKNNIPFEYLSSITNGFEFSLFYLFLENNFSKTNPFHTQTYAMIDLKIWNLEILLLFLHCTCTHQVMCAPGFHRNQHVIIAFTCLL